jgi:CDP-diacylglycerol--glycerol-3-phosphate 3-phosphatidyltransferase
MKRQELFRNKCSQIANFLSISRIVFAFALFFAEPLGIAFCAIYFICVLTDILDGYIARKTRTESKLGEKLDSVADLTFVVVLMIILFPVINPSVEVMIWIGIIGIIRVSSLLVAFVKYKTFAILHTYGNKITGLLLCVFPFAAYLVQSHQILMYIMCGVASISALEELVIHLMSDELRPNRGSLFDRRTSN